VGVFLIRCVKKGSDVSKSLALTRCIAGELASKFYRGLQTSYTAFVRVCSNHPRPLCLIGDVSDAAETNY